VGSFFHVMWYASPATSKFGILSSPFFADATARSIVYWRPLRTLANSVPRYRLGQVGSS